MAGIIIGAKKKLEKKFNSCQHCVRITIEELKGNMEEVNRNMAILEYYIKKGQGFAQNVFPSPKVSGF